MSSIRTKRRTSIVDRLIQEMQRALDDGRTSVADLVRATGLSRMQIYRLRTRENAPTFEAAEKIARCIGFEIVLKPTAG